MTRQREIGYALLRLTFGVVFLFAGIGKFIGGLTGFVGTMNQHFSGKLPAMMVMPFAYVLPFGEVTAGALIVFGLFTRVGLTISGLLLAGLTFGVVFVIAGIGKFIGGLSGFVGMMNQRLVLK